MARREIGLMGYIGEAVVEQWLRIKYQSDDYEVVSQIIPSGISRRGGGYLDFGVVRRGENTVEAVYEVKSQDYIPDKDFSINKALSHIWNHNGPPLEFSTQDRKTYKSCQDTTAFLVLLVGPNEDGRQKIGAENLGNIILFEDVWRDLGNSLSRKELLEVLLGVLEEDVEKVLKILHCPKNGKRVTKEFTEIRRRQANE